MRLNVWRNVSSAPVQRSPLALCDAASTSVDDLIVFEIRYADRVGENCTRSQRTVGMSRGLAVCPAARLG